MKENNDPILAQAISNLPVHHPEEKVWVQLEASLFHFPSHALPVHEPDAALWNKIENTLAHPKSGTINYKKTGLLLLALLFTSLIGFQGYQQHQNKNLFTILNQHTIEPDEHQFISATLLLENQPNESTETSRESLAFREKTPTEPIEKAPLSAVSQVVPELLNNQPEPNQQGYHQKITHSIPTQLFTTATRETNTLSLSPLSTRKGMLNQNTDQLLPAACVNTECSPFSGSVPYFSLGIFGSTSQFMLGNKAQDTKVNNWTSVELDLTYHKGRLFFVTGLGSVFSNDEGKITYNYLQNELIDSYIYVDSVFFDPITGTTKYYTTTVDVYDSIEYSDQSQYTSQYQYLKIPIRVGYEIYSNQLLQVSLSGGISWIHQVKTHAKIPDFHKEDARILQTHFDEVTRNKDLFQLSAQIEIGFRLSQQVQLQLGPSINYFTQPLYQYQEVKNPTSWSIRAGIQYNF